jgi:hypothetical protein
VRGRFRHAGILRGASSAPAVRKRATVCGDLRDGVGVWSDNRGLHNGVRRLPGIAQHAARLHETALPCRATAGSPYSRERLSHRDRRSRQGTKHDHESFLFLLLRTPPCNLPFALRTPHYHLVFRYYQPALFDPHYFDLALHSDRFSLPAGKA